MTSPEPATPLNRFLRSASRPFLRLLWGFKADGLEHIPETGRVIVAVNHRHWWDAVLAASVVGLRRYPRFVSKEELFRNPVAAWFFRQQGCIAVDRRRGGGDVQALRRAAAVLEDEGCLGIYPEGTQARDGRPLRPKPGVGFLASVSGAPVVPARLRNTERFPRLVEMGVRFGPPMRYEGDGGRASCQAFAERVMARVYEL